MVFGKNINKYYLKYWYLFLIGIIALVVVDYAYTVIPPKIIESIIDGLYEGTLTNELLTTQILQFVVVLAISFTCRILWRIGFFGAGFRIAKDLRHELFKKSLTLSQTFYSDNKVGGLMSYYINDVQSVRESMGWGTMMVFDTLCLIPMVLTNMFMTNWLVTIICIIPLSMIAVLGTIVGKYMEKKYKKRQDAFESLSDFTQESISGIRVVKAFVREAHELRAFSKTNKYNEKVNVEYLKLSIMFNVMVEVLIWLVYLLIILIGSLFVLNMSGNDALNGLKVAELTKLVAYFDALLWPMFAIGDIINMHSRGAASLKRIDFILEQKNDLIEKEDAIKVEHLDGNIKFNHLSFKYPDSKEAYALNDVSFEVKAGEFLGIIGRTGSSKTTLVNLLLRLYNIEDNEILIDGVDIMDYEIKSLREQIGYVPQDNFLYSTSIESNIAFSTTSPSRDKVEKEAIVAGVHSDIMQFPMAYQTKLGERGVSVSGGQKQRISIARALYKDPSILILDDSLSAVDTKTESEILKYLKEERKGRTTILIAHRVSSIKDADKILVLGDNGSLSGFGTHEELLKNNEIYKETYHLQQLDEVGGVSHE
ncbi:MAG: ABC transporter ATP-binding protein/permease [Gammaproteobacteria bacterium]|nr:ABC transporter ATP-binding protein/permease [Gammaproteobacteria bacterium]